MVTLAVAVLLIFATLVAVMVMVWGLLSAAGALYRPLLEIVPKIAPPAQFTDQVTPVLGVPVTAAVNC
ncbi:MAG: hypothetical protein ABSG79_07780 [Bryobacteraceae bacterium]|jgi:hypothetical protein